MSNSAQHPTPAPADMIAGMLTQTLGGAFDSIKEQVTGNIMENGEQYLHEAVERIKQTTSSVVEWAKENPVKTTLAVAALAAVSTFLVHTMTGSSSVSSAEASDDADAQTPPPAGRSRSGGKAKRGKQR